MEKKVNFFFVFDTVLALMFVAVLLIFFTQDSDYESAKSGGGQSDLIRVEELDQLEEVPGLSAIYAEGLRWEIELPEKYAAEPLEEEYILRRGIDPSLIFPWYEDGPPYPDSFSVEWKGLLRIDRPGRYFFQTESDDGSCLYINGDLVVNNWGNHTKRKRSGIVQLEPGKHRVALRYYNTGGRSAMQVYWQPLGLNPETSPKKRFIKPLPADNLTTLVPIDEALGKP